jgi:hypothetical protein
MKFKIIYFQFIKLIILSLYIKFVDFIDDNILYQESFSFIEKAISTYFTNYKIIFNKILKLILLNTLNLHSFIFLDS